MLATGSQPEPSAKAPCTKTTFLICCVMTILLRSKDPASHLHPKRAFAVNESRVECPMPAVVLTANSSVIDGPSRYPLAFLASSAVGSSLHGCALRWSNCCLPGFVRERLSLWGARPYVIDLLLSFWS